MYNKKYAVDIRDVFSDNISSLKISNNFLIKFIIKIIYLLETKLIKHAQWINIVSPGFMNYKHFKPHNDKIHIYTNGIDNIFIENRKNIPSGLSLRKKTIHITYAGNIGYGQGLEKIVILIANHFKSKIAFNIIGDGNSLSILQDKIWEFNLSNVKIIEPLSRDKLIEHYNSADILFLQLNNVDAFKNVLPSKIFEYGSFDKPILAGVSGTAENFLIKNLPQSYIYHPNRPNDAIVKINQILENKKLIICNDEFVNNFTREKIMGDMLKNIYDSLK